MQRQAERKFAVTKCKAKARADLAAWLRRRLAASTVARALDAELSFCLCLVSWWCVQLWPRRPAELAWSASPRASPVSLVSGLFYLTV